MLRILGRPTSINVRKVLWTADEIGLDYVHEAEWATPAAPSSSPEMIALNPNGLIPVIEDDGKVLWESNAICRYLARRHDRADLMPTEAHAQGIVDQWMDWQATDFNPAGTPAFLALTRNVATHPARLDESLSRWDARLRILEARLEQTGAYVAGQTFTVADIVIGLSVHRYRSTPRTQPLGPVVESWMAQLNARSPAQRHLTPQTP